MCMSDEEIKLSEISSVLDSNAKINILKMGKGCKFFISDEDPNVKITALREAPRNIKEDLIRKVYTDPCENVRIEAVNQCMHIDCGRIPDILEVLSKDKSPYIRCRVIETGYNSDEFATDTAAIVRKTYVKHRIWSGKAEMSEIIRKLAKDCSDQVRIEIVKRKMMIEELKTDESEYVRAEIAKQGYYPEWYVCDKSPIVRREVAKLGLYPEKLIKDTSYDVAVEVFKLGLCIEHFLDEDNTELEKRKVFAITMGYSIEEIKKEKNESFDIDQALYRFAKKDFYEHCLHEAFNIPYERTDCFDYDRED